MATFGAALPAATAPKPLGENARTMEYLTTHDLVWINNNVTGKVNPYDYFKLEACMAGQYSYGDSQDVAAQAGTFLRRLLTTHPFLDGNRRTAFIALLTFLNANGYATRTGDDETVTLLHAAESGQIEAEAVIAAIAAPAATPISGSIPLRRLMMHECNLHTEALRLLTAGDA